MQGDGTRETIFSLRGWRGISMGCTERPRRLRDLWRSSWARRLLYELNGMDQLDDPQETALRRAIQTLSQSDPLLKLLEQVKLRRMKPTGAGLRAITESWLATYHQVLASHPFTAAALARLDPAPRLAVLIESGMLEPDNAAHLSLKQRYEGLLSAVVR
jgi:hypothetical protein